MARWTMRRLLGDTRPSPKKANINLAQSGMPRSHARLKQSGWALVANKICSFARGTTQFWAGLMEAQPIRAPLPPTVGRECI